GDREMTVCKMQAEFVRASANYHRAYLGLQTAIWRTGDGKSPEPKATTPPPARGLGHYYCRAYEWVKGLVSGPREAHAATLPLVAQQRQNPYGVNPDEPIDVTIQRTELEAARR